MSISTGKNLPPEITEAILRRLPAKSLGRFKSVSKTWYSLISDPKFIKNHLHQITDHPKTTTKLILVSDTKALYSVDINALPPYPTTDDIAATGKELTFRSPPIRWKKILGSCNGLVLAKDEDNAIFIMNPTTQELYKVPISPFALPDRESFVTYGFGYDSSTDDYKIISISFWNTDSDSEFDHDCTDKFVSVYSLRNDSWRKLRNSPYDHAVVLLNSGVLVNQHLHWLTNTRGGIIVAFSLANEELKEIELPDSIVNHNAVFNMLVVLGGKLGIYGTPFGDDLWVMEEYGVVESWTLVCTDGVPFDQFKPVCLVERSDGDIVLSDEDEVVVYNRDEGRRRNVRIEGGPSRFVIGCMYVESIESPKRTIRAP